MAEWKSEKIREAMVVHYDRRGRKISTRRVYEKISLSIRQLDDSLFFILQNKSRKDVFISSSASGLSNDRLSLTLVVLVEDSVVSISIPETKAGLYFVFSDESDLSSLLQIVQHFHPTPPKQRVLKLKLSPLNDGRDGLLTQKRRKTIEAEESMLSPESLTLSSIQHQIVQSCLDGNNLFLTGGAGTGKSTLLNYLVHVLIQKHGSQSVYVTATTGLAACAIGGITIHQFGGIKAMSRGSHGHPIQV
jgi:hypothetical protein